MTAPISLAGPDPKDIELTQSLEEALRYGPGTVPLHMPCRFDRIFFLFIFQKISEPPPEEFILIVTFCKRFLYTEKILKKESTLKFR
jgi:hypothetical protein